MGCAGWTATCTGGTSTDEELSPSDSFKFLRVGPRRFGGPKKRTTLFIEACLCNPRVV
ncbi:hypothetical protein QJS10_CPB18g00754 [Acorus calamus]|uniref:Uncharacterized protein n=1 Tax=Acorus calamus TaxID=4465 RepID=A0AAV9CL71_ACOCL|nr:hypothetical protein QJS10_CPB18g00754 [Acorus calamus]